MKIDFKKILSKFSKSSPRGQKYKLGENADADWRIVFVVFLFLTAGLTWYTMSSLSGFSPDNLSDSTEDGVSKGPEIFQEGLIDRVIGEYDKRKKLAEENITFSLIDPSI